MALADVLLDVGDSVTLSSPFYNAADALADPTTVTLHVCNPAGTVTTYVYLIDVALVRDSLGLFHIDLPVTLAGLWSYRWVGTGAVVTAEAGSFWVRSNEVNS